MTPKTCGRAVDCVRQSGHAEHCRRDDGSVILARRALLAEEQIADARAPASGIERAMEELDHQVEEAQAAFVDPPKSYRPGDGPMLALIKESMLCLYGTTEECAAAHARLSGGQDPGYWAGDGTLRYVHGMPSLAEWMAMHGFAPVPVGQPVDPIEEHARRVHADASASGHRDGVFAIDAPRTDITTLTGPEHAAFRSFADVCARMEAHNKASSATAAALNKEYIAVLERFSAIAAKAGAR